MKDEPGVPRKDEVIELFANLDTRSLVRSLAAYLAGEGSIELVRREAILASRGVHLGRVAPHTMLVAVKNALREAGGGSHRVGPDGRIKMTANQLAPWLIELVFDPNASIDESAELSA